MARQRKTTEEIIEDLKTEDAPVLSAEETEKVLEKVKEDIEADAKIPKPVKPACVCATCQQVSIPKPGQIIR